MRERSTKAVFQAKKAPSGGEEEEAEKIEKKSEVQLIPIRLFIAIAFAAAAAESVAEPTTTTTQLLLLLLRK